MADDPTVDGPSLDNVHPTAQPSSYPDLAQAIDSLAQTMSRALQGANVVVDVQQLRTILQALQQTNHLLNQLIQQGNERDQEMKQRMDSVENNVAELRSNSNWETMNATRTDIIEPVPPKPGLPAYDPEIFPRTVGQMSRLTEAECDELAASWGIRFGPRNVSVSMKREKIGYFVGQPYSD